MNRKHFRLISDIIRERIHGATSGDQAETVATLGRDLARICGAENHNFDYRRFYTACGLDATGNLSGHFAHVHSYCNPVSDAAV